jgi:PAS domain S-box-containing protein
MKQDLYFQALSSFPQALCIIDEDHRIVFANKKFEQIPAFSENIKGMFFWQVFSVVDENKLIKFTKDFSSQEEPRSLTGCHYESADGTSSWWDIGFQSITTIYCKNYFMITMNDVTDKYISNQKQSSDDFEHIIQSIKDPLVVFNQNMEGIFANKAFHTLMEVELPYPYTIKDWNTIYEYLDFNGKKLRQNELPIQRSLKGESVHNLEVQLFHTQNQTKTFYYISTYPINIEGLDEKCFVLIMRDVTKDLGQEKSRKDFIQIAAHELRTPLTAIKGFTQLVLERYKERQKKWFFQPTIQLIKEIERDQTFFKVILDEAIRLDQLTNELLSIFKIDQGKFEMSLENVKLSQLTKEVIEEFVIPDEFHHIHYIEEALQTSVKIDSKQVKRVIQNLLSNAVKYSPNHSDIYVFLEEKDNRVRLSVTDEGIGIPEDQQSRIFERFFRAYSPSHEDIHGYGVGLHICQEIMQQHESEICFKSNYGAGSTFYFELPLEDK